MKKSEVMQYIEETTDFLPMYVYPNHVTMTCDSGELSWTRGFSEGTRSLKSVLDDAHCTSMTEISFDNEGIETVVVLPE